MSAADNAASRATAAAIFMSDHPGAVTRQAHFDAGESGVDDKPERDELPASVHEPAEHGLAQRGAARRK